MERHGSDLTKKSVGYCSFAPCPYTGLELFMRFSKSVRRKTFTPCLLALQMVISRGFQVVDASSRPERRPFPPLSDRQRSTRDVSYVPHDVTILFALSVLLFLLWCEIFGILTSSLTRSWRSPPFVPVPLFVLSFATMAQDFGQLLFAPRSQQVLDPWGEVDNFDVDLLTENLLDEGNLASSGVTFDFK